MALASRVSISYRLGDAADLDRAWSAYVGWGDGSWPFQTTSDYDARWTCGSYESIETVECQHDGAPVEDASRGSYPIPDAAYVGEALQGMTAAALFLHNAGYPAWTVNDGQVCRVGAFAERHGVLNHHSTSYHATGLLNDFCGTSYPANDRGEGRLLSAEIVEALEVAP